MKRALWLLCIVASILGSLSCTDRTVRTPTGERERQITEYCPDGYEALFSLDNLHDIEIVISETEWSGMLSDMWIYQQDDFMGSPRTGNYRRATFVYHGPIGDVVIPDVGFRTKGNLNRPYPQDKNGNLHKAHFKIRFNHEFDLAEGSDEYEYMNGRRFAETRSIELRMHTSIAASGNWDISQMRELFAYKLMRDAGVTTSRTGAARVWITIGDQKHYFGIYMIREPMDKSFLTKRYGADGDNGNLYKALWGDSGPANLGPVGNPNRFIHLFAQDMRIIGVEDWRNHYRPTYGLKTNESNPDHSELLAFIYALNNFNGPVLSQYLDSVFEVDKFLRYLAMNVLLGKWDDYWAVGNNYYLYFNNNGKIEHFRWISTSVWADGRRTM